MNKEFAQSYLLMLLSSFFALINIFIEYEQVWLPHCPFSGAIYSTMHSVSCGYFNKSHPLVESDRTYFNCNTRKRCLVCI